MLKLIFFFNFKLMTAKQKDFEQKNFIELKDQVEKNEEIKIILPSIQE